MAITTDKTTSLGRFIKEQIKALEKEPFVKIGILQADYDSEKTTRDQPSESEAIKVTLGQVALANEFGTKTIPQRSYIRSTFDQNYRKWSRLTEEFRKKVERGDMTVERALGLVGEKIRGDIINTIVTLSEPPNSPATIARKKSSNPLVDQGQLKGSIQYEVVI